MLRDLDESGGVNSFGFLSLFFWETVSVLVLSLSHIFRILLGEGLFPQQ